MMFDPNLGYLPVWYKFIHKDEGVIRLGKKGKKDKKKMPKGGY